ncbi:uncharacterized protein KY384_001721 [Bacidia gigantensis]|uniref:uncharacterized protein n=1 Tax=Bacidia gigantensis TaxID=2732470 RepID=UPI001D04650F|nr:uncharacterized protein KY384_001721 [Bacidia gigantensis]KAG8533978.1 hypothetical protein KY384_001721 [Bacidia gigantensis]
MAAAGQGAGLAGMIAFALENGETGIISSADRRAYDHIIHHTVGAIPPVGLEANPSPPDAHVVDILSKSKLPEDDLDEIWELAKSVESEESEDGYWSTLEVYVALHFAQLHARIESTEMALLYTGVALTTGKKLGRKSSYKQARAASLAFETAPPMPQIPASEIQRTRSQAAPHGATSLHPSNQWNSVVDADTSLHRRHSHQTSSERDNTSLSQVGLEAVNELDTILREGSVRSDTATRAQRLATILKTRCPDISLGSVIQSAGPRVSAANEGEAHAALVRIHRPQFKDPSKGFGKLRSKSTKDKKRDTQTWIFSDEEKSRALQEAVDTGFVGIAEALLDKGTDPNQVKVEEKSKVLRSKSVTAKSVNYILKAAANNDTEMVSLLASRGVSSNSKELALDQAVKQSLPAVVLTLLQYNVDANALGGSIFQAAISSQRPDIVKLLLRARSNVKTAYITANLPLAVSQGNQEMISILVSSEADVNAESATALRKAVQSQNVDLVLPIMKGRPSKETVSIAFQDAFSANSSASLVEQYLLLEILLCGGAEGNNVAETLIHVVRAGHRNLAKLLILHGASTQYKNAQALRIAVAGGNVGLVACLLKGSISADSINGAFNEITKPYDEQQAYALMSALIFKGATGRPLDDALVATVQQGCIALVKLLLDHNACVNYKGAQALKIAASAGDLFTLRILSNKGRPQTQSMDQVLPMIPPSPPKLKYEMTRCLIEAVSPAKLQTSALDLALVKAIDSETEAIDYNLVNILVTSGANVDCQQGQCFQLAARRGVMELLQIFIQRSSHLSLLSTAVPNAMRLSNSALRRKVVALMLDHGAQGPTVSQALIDSLSENPMDEDLMASLLTKADVDYREGQALNLAMQYSTRILSRIIQVGKPGQKTMAHALTMCINPRTREREAKLDLFLKAGVNQETLDGALVSEISSRSGYSMHVVKALLKYGASCTFDDGKALELAARNGDSKLLEQLLGTQPSVDILPMILLTAMKETPRGFKFDTVGLILNAGARGDKISQALTYEVCSTTDCELRIVQLLITYGADLSYKHGQALKHTVSVPLSIELLRTLIESKGASKVISRLVPLAMKHIEPVRLPLLQIILEKGASGPDVDTALVTAVSESPPSQLTVEILLRYGASLDHDHAKAVKCAAENGDPTILQALLSKSCKLRYLSEALQTAMQASQSENDASREQRFACIKLLTDVGVQNDDSIHRGLIQAVEERDHFLAQHFLNNGGDPNHDNGASVREAAVHGDIISLQMLLRVKSIPGVCSVAFEAASQEQLKHPSISIECLYNVYSMLVTAGSAGPAVDAAFLEALIDRQPSKNDFVDTVLKAEGSLDVNFKKGKSLCIAASAGLFPIVEALLKRNPSKATLRSAFMSALRSRSQEKDIIKVTRLFLEHSKNEKFVYFQDKTMSGPLYTALHQHAGKPELLEYLLDNGCSTEAQFTWQFSRESEVEETSALLWLICQADRSTDTRTVKLLLDRGGDANFRTPCSSNSPLIMAAAASQPDLVMQLLKAGAHAQTENALGETPLQHATSSGCVESVKHLISYNAQVNDESLHMGARLARAEAVKALLEHGAAIDYPGTLSCNGRTALGEICQMASPDDDPAELKQTIAELVKAKPDPGKLTKGRAHVILALENDNPLGILRILFAAWPSLREHLNADYNIYHGQGNLRYSPTAYARHFLCRRPFDRRHLSMETRCCNLPNCPGPALEDLLHHHGCLDRFWNDKAGANQPSGTCRPPQHIIDAQIEAAAIRKEQEKQARIRAEKERQRLEAQAIRDAEAAADRQRERDHQAVIEEGRRADAREDRRRLEFAESQRRADEAAAESERRAEEAAARSRRDAEEARHRAEAAREKREHEARLARTRSLANEEERHRTRQEKGKMAALEKQARLEKEVLRERRQFVESAAGLVTQAQIAGVGQREMGQILGEVGEGARGRYLTNR